MIVLDTNVVSETMRRKPERSSVIWLDAQPPTELFLCAPVLAELCFGVALMHPSKRKSELAGQVENLTQNVFNGRILAFDSDAARRYAEIAAGRRLAGRPISIIDAMIAAIVRSNNATLATRNVADFEETGIEVVNPFTA